MMVILMFSAISNLTNFIQRPISFLHYQWQKKGDLFSFYFGPKKCIVITDPELAKTILNDDNYQKNRATFDKLIPILGEKGIVQLEGEEWKRIREVTQPNFNRSFLEDYLNIFEKNTQFIKNQLLATGTMDCFEAMGHYALGNLVGITLGLEWDETSAEIREQFKILHQLCGQNLHSTSSIPLWVPTPKHLTLKKHRRLLLNAIQKRINQVNTPFYTSIIEKCPHYKPLDQITTFLFGGYETTTAALSITFYYLSKHSDIQEKIYQEVREVVGSDPEFTLEKLKQMSYTEAVFREALRLYPPVWALSREVKKKTYLNDLLVKPGNMVLINIRGLHRHPNYWPEPNHFQPERFLNQSFNKHSYIPFGMGKRICSGFQVAMCEAVYLMAKLILDFKFELKEGTRLRTRAMITQRPVEKIELVATKR